MLAERGALKHPPGKTVVLLAESAAVTAHIMDVEPGVRDVWWPFYKRH